MSDMEADAFIAAALPGMYASVTSALVETRKRLGSGWLRGLLRRNDGEGPRVLDVGSGGAGLAAWQQILQAEWDLLRETGEVAAREPPGKKTVVVGSDSLRHRISRFLHNTTFPPGFRTTCIRRTLAIASLTRAKRLHPARPMMLSSLRTR